MKEGINLLFRLHETFSSLAATFRNRVCEECNISMPTFYRKMRSVDTTNENGKVIPALSNAEKDKILELAEEVKNGLIEVLTAEK